VYPVGRFDSERWFSSEQVIFLTVFRVFGEKARSILVKRRYFWVSCFPRYSAEALVRSGGKIKYSLIAYTFSATFVPKIVAIEPCM